MKKNAYYIVTIHNKESLILKVLEGIKVSTENSSYHTNIVCVLDGCTDSSSEIVDTFAATIPTSYTMHKIYENDVHELLSINSALRYINTLQTNPDDLIFLLQDDVVLQEESLNELIECLYSTHEQLGYVSFRCGLSTDLDQNGLLYEHSFLESEDGHWKQLNLDHFLEVKNKEFGFCEELWR